MFAIRQALQAYERLTLAHNGRPAGRRYVCHSHSPCAVDPNTHKINHLNYGSPVAHRPSVISLTAKKTRERLSDRADEPSSQRLSLNRSQYGDCSTKYNTPAGT
jgi:hypothetical protein